jgi:hypothetical protein
MAVDKEIKKKVIEDWQNAMPQLCLYAQDKLYKVVGSIIVGLELIKLPRAKEYRPHFVIYPLWKKDVKSNLDYPILIKEFYNKKGLQYSIPYENHSSFFNDVLNSIKKQSPLPFEGNIFLKKLMFLLDDHSQKPPLSAAPNSYLQAVLQEAKLKIALSISSEEAQSILEQINKRSWDVSHFKACGVNVSNWLQSLQEVINNRDEFLKQIETNKQDKKLAKLGSSELTV